MAAVERRDVPESPFCRDQAGASEEAGPGSDPVQLEFKMDWSGAQDLNPGPHGPELAAIPCNPVDSWCFSVRFFRSAHQICPGLSHSSAGLLHELHESSAPVDVSRREGARWRSLWTYSGEMPRRALVSELSRPPLRDGDPRSGSAPRSREVQFRWNAVLHAVTDDEEARLLPATPQLAPVTRIQACP